MYEITDLLKLASRDFILGNITKDERISFIEDQIRDPFDSGDSNYLKPLVKSITDKEELEEVCQTFLVHVQDIYPHLKLDFSECDQQTIVWFKPIYKFFVKNVTKIMFIFIREYLFTPKNRKELTDTFDKIKTPTYPKEQYGKREFYILVTKLSQIVDEIFEDDIKLGKFIKYVEKNGDSPVWLGQILDAIDRGYIMDTGVVDDMYKLFKKSEAYRPTMNKLEMEINTEMIIPYMKENGMIDVRIPPVEEIHEDLDGDKGEEDDYDGDEND